MNIQKFPLVNEDPFIATSYVKNIEPTKNTCYNLPVLQGLKMGFELKNFLINLDIDTSEAQMSPSDRRVAQVSGIDYRYAISNALNEDLANKRQIKLYDLYSKRAESNKTTIKKNKWQLFFSLFKKLEDNLSGDELIENIKNIKLENVDFDFIIVDPYVFSILTSSRDLIIDNQNKKKLDILLRGQIFGMQVFVDYRLSFHISTEKRRIIFGESSNERFPNVATILSEQILYNKDNSEFGHHESLQTQFYKLDSIYGMQELYENPYCLGLDFNIGKKSKLRKLFGL